MPIFKYTVVNKEGKHLAGTIETADLNTAKQELNGLGFSVLEISLAQEQSGAETDQTLIKFSFEAIDKTNKKIVGTIPAHNQEEAVNRLVKEYDLTITGIWKEGTSEEEIKRAREEGLTKLAGQKAEEQLLDKADNVKSDIEKRKEQIFRERIDHVLNKIYELLKTFENDISPDQRAEINKKIDKLLRIKASTNFDYILETTKEILKFIQAQEKIFKEKGQVEKKLQIEFQSKILLDELKRAHIENTSWSSKIAKKISEFKIRLGLRKQNIILKNLDKILGFLQNMFETPPEITELEAKIKGYNTQLWELAQLYLKEPTPEYKQKVKESLSTVWSVRKKTKQELKELRARPKNKTLAVKPAGKKIPENAEEPTSEHFLSAFVDEVNSFSGWLLGIYLVYYFASLYITTKDFGLSSIPRGFFFYDSHIFKYLLTILFLFHCSLSTKTTFFRNNITASIVMVPLFLLSSTIVLLNY